MTRWFEETLHPGFHSRLGIERVLHETKTEHQHLIIFDNPEFGRVLALDGVAQTIEPAAQGEIADPVVELSKLHLRAICGDAYEDSRTELVIADGVEFVNQTERRFDVIIVDSTDPIGPGEVLFGQHFYGGCKRCLNDGGILVTQNGVPFVQGEELTGTMDIFRGLFADVSCYRAGVPAYIGGDMTFGWGSDDAALSDVSLAVLQERFTAAAIETDYYTPDVHRGAFALPPYIRKLMGYEAASSRRRRGPRPG